MHFFDSIAGVPEGFGPSAVSIGKFDGVHAGHRAVIAQLVEHAGNEHLVPTVVTFDRHPAALLAPEKCPPQLVSNRQKVELLAQHGVAATLMLTFDPAFAAVAPEDFVRGILVDALHARLVLVGEDFRFGRGGAGTAQTLRDLGDRFGFRVEIVSDVRPDSDRRVSSTWIRDLLTAGEVDAAAVLLGRSPSVCGMVVHGAKRGRELGFPTANLSPESEGLIPADGVYAGWLTDDGTRYPAAISVGSNPTFVGVPPKQVEAYVLDREIDLYDHIVEVTFVSRIRGQVAYAGVGPLIAQMTDDVERVRVLLQ